MGTNYYLHYNKCDKCGRFKERHIGKSSGGWCFGLHVYPEEHINDLPEWEFLWQTGEIFDEYGEKITPTEMKRIITERKWNGSNLDKTWFSRNSAEPGPNDLARFQIDGKHCIGHGAGTWDLEVGDFS
jgi:hypothetical protein